MNTTIDEKETTDEKTIVEKFNHFFVNIGPKLASKMPVSNTHFEQYIKYEGPILERRKLCDEELKNVFSALKNNKSQGYDGISTNVVKSVSEEIFGILQHMLNPSTNQGMFPENMKIAYVTPFFYEDCVCYSIF